MHVHYSEGRGKRGAGGPRGGGGFVVGTQYPILSLAANPCGRLCPTRGLQHDRVWVGLGCVCHLVISSQLGANQGCI